jgi:opacity protein-like surface antigen
MDAPGNMGDFFSFKNYGTSIGWGAQFNFKFGLGPEAQYRPYLTLGYSQLQNSDDKKAYIADNEIGHGYPLTGSQLLASTDGTSAIILRNPYVGAGFEYAFTTTDYKKRQWIPFFGVEMVANIITGVYRQTPTVSTQPQLSGVPITFSIKTDLRVGIGLGAGLDLRFTKGFGLVTGFKWKYANLIGKKSDFLLDENKMNLLDAGAQNLNNYLSNDRNIGYIEIYLGASFYVGKSKK